MEETIPYLTKRKIKSVKQKPADIQDIKAPDPVDSQTKAVYIGIDPGVETGLAAWDKEHARLILVETLSITQAMRKVLQCRAVIALVRIEDARKRKWFGNTGRERLKGAGSVERDCTIWQAFCEENGIPYELVAPKDTITKVSADYFKKLTRWTGRTSVHARDATLLVFGR